MNYGAEHTQQMPIALIRQWANPHYSPNDDLALMESIMQNGIQDPLVLSIGVWSRRVRLDTGNHRIYIAPRLGFTHLPVVARVSNYCVHSPGNGDHSYTCQHILPKREWITEDYYARPSDVLDIMNLLIGLKM